MLLLAVVALGVPLALSLRDRVDSEVRSQALSQAEVVSATAAELIDPPRREALDHLAQVAAENVRGRVIIVDAVGRLLADSAGAEVGRRYAGRPEVSAALAGRREQLNRYSETLDTEILATAVPVLERGRFRGAVRITQSYEAVEGAVRTSVLDIAAVAAIVLALGMAGGALIARRIARPIHRLDLAAQRVAGGDLEATVAVEGSAEQRSLARTFNEMTVRLRRLLGAQQDFVADASHQLRTPLTGLRLRLEAVAERGHDDPELEDDAVAALGEVDRLAQIVEELLILSRAGEHDLPGERIDLAAATRRAAERWRGTAAEQGMAIEVEQNGAVAAGWCAESDLDRSIDAVLENALLYSPSGSAVTLAAAAGRIVVRDRGPGLDPGEEESVFERFNRGSAGRRSPGGTGLGLPIARELTRQWGGDVTLRNRAGGGLEVVIEVER